LTRFSGRIVLRDAAVVAPGYVIPGLVSLALVGVLFARLGANEFGLWALIYAVAFGVPLLTTSAVEAVTLRYQHRERQGIRWQVWAPALVATAIVGGIVALLLIPERTPEIAGATSLLSVAVGAYLIRIAQLRADLRFAASSVAASTRAIAGGLLATIGALTLGSAAASAIGMAIGVMVAIVLSTIGGQRVRETVDDKPAAGTADLRVYGSASLVIAVGLFVLSVGDRFVLSAVRPLDEVGVYAAVYNVVDLVIRLGPAVVMIALRPRLFRAWDVDDFSRLVPWLGGLSGLILWGSCALSLGFVIVARFVGAGVDIQGLVGPIAIGISAAAVASGVSFAYSASERQVRLAFNVVGCAVLNIGLNAL